MLPEAFAAVVIVGGIVPKARASAGCARYDGRVRAGLPLDGLVARVALAIERAAMPACGDRAA
ncbi:hypothetical protein [Burkholderia plantarii]|uniref:hypothetical protein n=1 Tax=Burkholderia plantarii TaxID=41899 RepID=UPI0018DDB7A2|nr:hypothetical protein [Burkholderia plantarii]MBI0330610.1 hypothetical protein [Burkholderia plantarii]